MLTDWQVSPVESVMRPRITRVLSHALAWLNFALLVSVPLKFIPLLISLSHGLNLSHLEDAHPWHAQRVWALDLVSDTALILLVWYLLGHLNRWWVGAYRWRPWRPLEVLNTPDREQQQTDQATG